MEWIKSCLRRDQGKDLHPRNIPEYLQRMLVECLVLFYYRTGDIVSPRHILEDLKPPKRSHLQVEKEGKQCVLPREWHAARHSQGDDEGMFQKDHARGKKARV